MKVLIDVNDLAGPREFTGLLDAGNPPKITRKLNEASTVELTVLGEIGPMRIPADGAKVWLEKADGSRWFSGYVDGAPQQEFVGKGVRGAVVRCRMIARSDEIVLDRKPLPEGLAVAESDAATVVKRWTESAGAGEFDTSNVVDVGSASVPRQGDGVRWSEVVASVARQCRSSYVAENGAISLRRLGAKVHELDDADPRFIPQSLVLEQRARALTDWTVVGEIGPGSYVKDYFIGDGHTLRFPMSQPPFLRPGVTWLEEEYADGLSGAKWIVQNASALPISRGKLSLAGGSGVDGETTLVAAERFELGGCAVFEHGAVVLNSASDGVIGGVYDGSIAIGNCVAGFRVTSAGANTMLQPVINGASAGATLQVVYGHRYELTTRMFASEVYRVGATYRWSGGEQAESTIAADVRFVMEVRDLDAGTPIPEASVLYEGAVKNAPALVTYAVVNSTRMQGTIAYTRVRRVANAEVRTTSTADGSMRTRIVGMIGDGAECSVTTGPAVYFYAPFKPASGDQVVVRYRAAERAAMRVFAEDEFAANAAVVKIESPIARTREDCGRAAEALLADAMKPAWRGSYETWTDLLPSGEVAPGDGIHVVAASRGVEFTGVVREVETTIVDGANERALYRLKFSEDGAETIAIDHVPFTSSLGASVLSRASGEVNSVPTLCGAEVVQITSTSVEIDAGVDVANGCGIEVRREGDFGWGEGNDRNLVARFTSRNFTVPRSTRSEDYYLRMYDAVGARRYSPMTTLLHVDVKDDSI